MALKIHTSNVEETHIRKSTPEVNRITMNGLRFLLEQANILINKNPELKENYQQFFNEIRECIQRTKRGEDQSIRLFSLKTLLDDCATTEWKIQTSRLLIASKIYIKKELIITKKGLNENLSKYWKDCVFCCIDSSNNSKYYCSDCGTEFCPGCIFLVYEGPICKCV